MFDLATPYTAGIAIWLIIVTIAIYKNHKNGKDERETVIKSCKSILNLTSKFAVVIGIYGVYNVTKAIHLASFKTLSNQQLTEKVMHLYGLVGILTVLAATILMWYVTKKAGDKL